MYVVKLPVCVGYPFTNKVLFALIAAMQSTSEQKLTNAKPETEEPPSASPQKEALPVDSGLSSAAPIPQKPPPVPPLPGFYILCAHFVLLSLVLSVLLFHSDAYDQSPICSNSFEIYSFSSQKCWDTKNRDPGVYWVYLH